jgi:hypothetical protein
MVERRKTISPSALYIINDFNTKFLICYQTIPERWYAFNLDNECCECEDRVSICKHLLAMRKLVEENITHMKCMLPAQENGFVNNFNDVGEDDVITPPHSPGPIPLSSSMDNIGLQDDSLGIVHVHTSKVEDISQTQNRLAKLIEIYVGLS